MKTYSFLSLISFFAILSSAGAENKSYYQVFQLQDADSSLVVETNLADDAGDSAYRVFTGTKGAWTELKVEDSILGFSNTILHLEGNGTIDIPSPTNMGQKPTWVRGRAAEEL